VPINAKEIRRSLVINESKLKEVLTALTKSRDRWCAECVDDSEDMFTEIPELLSYAVQTMEEALGLPSSTLVIDSAMYGTDLVLRNVTSTVKDLVVGDHLELRVDNGILGGDPVPGSVKTLTVTYMTQSGLQCVSAKEGEMLRINCELM
jgi:hypothetical protein